MDKNDDMPLGRQPVILVSLIHLYVDVSYRPVTGSGRKRGSTRKAAVQPSSLRQPLRF